MNIKCYWDSNLKCCPYKRYIEIFFKDKDISFNKKKKVFAIIKNKIFRIKNCKNIKCIGELSKSLYPYNYWEIRIIKNSKKLIRITFFHDIEKREIIILDGFEKPNKDLYNQKDQYDYDSNLSKSDYYLKEYIKNKKYEEYE
ncbi:MAG: hypothetical protein WC909_02475 [Candidatus Paceibacterota bacterium]|jgi:hypothetical protein